MHALHDLFSARFQCTLVNFRGQGLLLPTGDLADAPPALEPLASAELLLIGVTSYWGSLSAASKALFEFLTQADYDRSDHKQCLLARRRVFFINIGLSADDLELSRLQLLHLSQVMDLDVIGLAERHSVRGVGIDVPGIAAEILTGLRACDLLEG
jgi:NAD(P)H-dependent FMN reductase